MIKNSFYLSTAVISLLISTIAFADEERGALASALMSDSFAESSGIDVRGWASAGVTFNPGSHDQGYNGPVSFNDREDKCNSIRHTSSLSVQQKLMRRIGQSVVA